MKLKNKLFINFTILLFVLLNIFGYFLIQSIFINAVNKTIDDGYKEYAAIYLNLKSGEDMSKLLFTTSEVIQIKNDSYLKNVGTKNLDIVVQDKNQKLVYTTLKTPFTIPSNMNEFDTDITANYMIRDQGGKHELVINKMIQLDEEEYLLSYINSIETVYKERNNYFLLLLGFDVFAGVTSILVIYYFSSKISKPLDSLTNNINEIIHNNYEVTLDGATDIVEINEIAHSFNLMSDEISSRIRILQLRNEEQQRFIDSLTHEIRTPLTSIIGYSSLHLNKQIDDKEAIQSSFDNIYQNGKRIESLSENLIKLITLDKEELDLHTIHILKVLESIQATLATRLTSTNIHFEIIGDDFTVMASEYLLITLFSNLIENALKAVATKENAHIQVVLDKNRVEIIDNGKGIPEDVLDKIKEPFFMVDASRKNSKDGFGLGLAICNDITKILQIQFGIESELHKGTKVTLVWGEDTYENV